MNSTATGLVVEWQLATAESGEAPGVQHALQRRAPQPAAWRAASVFNVDHQRARRIDAGAAAAG